MSSETNTVWPTFDDFWTAYDYRIDRARCERLWSKLAQADKEKAIRHAEAYVQSTYTDGKFPSRRHPGTYLHNRNWNDEALIPLPKDRNTDTDLARALAERFANHPK